MHVPAQYKLKKGQSFVIIYKIYHLCTILIKQTNLQAFEQSVQQCAVQAKVVSWNKLKTSKFRRLSPVPDINVSLA